MKASILISSFNRLGLFRRTLWAIAARGPTDSFEVVVCDDGSTEDVLGELRKYDSAFPWKFIRFDGKEFAKHTGLNKFHNNPSVTNNIAFRHSAGEFVFQQGNEVIAWGREAEAVREHPCERESVYDALLGEAEEGVGLVFSTTYDVPAEILDRLDTYGSNLTQGMVKLCHPWPLHSREYPSDVTNYISLVPRVVWEKLGGYDERYYGGISAEDSDFTRRLRALGLKTKMSEAVSLHQFHNGRTRYYCPPPRVITQARWDEGVAINHAYYNSWDGSYKNAQQWEPGSLGVGEVITNA